MNKTPTKQALEKKSPFKICFKGTTTDELILNLRKHTTPVPFTLQSSHRDCRAQLSKKNLKISVKREGSTESQRSTSRLFNFSPGRLMSNRENSEKNNLKIRTSTCSPKKKAQFLQMLMVENNKKNKEKELKRTLESLKSKFDSKIQISPDSSNKKKTFYQLKDIL